MTKPATTSQAPASASLSVVSPFEYLIDPILPAGEMHLFAGPSGAGKTTLLLQILQQWQKGEQVFGYPSKPTPFVFLACDRSYNGTVRILSRVGVDWRTFPFEAYLNKPGDWDIDKILMDAIKKCPAAQLFIIDGINSIVPGGDLTKYSTVSTFLKKLTRFCATQGKTIIGVVHTAKTKENEGYLNPRERLIGSVAWGGYSETIILVEPTEPDDPNCKARTVSLLPRNAPEVAFDMDFVDGLLQPRKQRVNADHLFTAWLDKIPHDKPFKFSEIVSAIPGIPKRTLQRLLSSCTKLTVDKRGSYLRKQDVLDLDDAIGAEDEIDRELQVTENKE